MPSNALSNFARWSGRCEEMRIMAEEMHDPTARAMMLRLSADYGRLAERAEEQPLWANRGRARLVHRRSRAGPLPQAAT